MRKEDLVNELNSLLEMEHAISVWQCLQIRKYELEEMVGKVRGLHRQVYGSDVERHIAYNSGHVLHPPVYSTTRKRRAHRLRAYGEGSGESQ